jgi:hypothetical protein
MIRARVQSRAFLRALACHGAPYAWATNVETSRVENRTALETWVLAIAGGAGAGGPLGEIQVMAAGTARVLARLRHAGDQFELGPGRAVELEITPAGDAIGISFTLRRAADGPSAGCRFQVRQAGLAAAPVFEIGAACDAVRLDPARFGYPQEGAWITIGPPAADQAIA